MDVFCYETFQLIWSELEKPTPITKVIKKDKKVKDILNGKN